MSVCECEKDHLLIKQGDAGNLFFIIDNGDLEVTKDGNFEKNISRGDGVGEMALIYNSPRTITVKCKTTCEVWYIDRFDFLEVIENIAKKQASESMKFFSKL